MAPEDWKVGSLKRRVRSHLARWEMKKCMPLWRDAHFEVKMFKAHQVQTTFGSCDVEKVHAVVARSTFRSWKCTKHTRVGPVLEVAMSKKCTPLWREAHFQVKMYKTHQVRTTFRSCDVETVHAVVARSTFWSQVRTTFGSCDVEKVHAAVARSTFSRQTVQSTSCSDHFWKFRCRFAWQAQGIVHLVKSEQNVKVLSHCQLQPPLHHTTLHSNTLHYNYNYTFTTFHYTTLLHSNTLHYNYNYTFTTFHYTTLHYTPPHSTIDSITPNYIQVHSATLCYTTLHYITLRYTTLHYTTLHYTTLPSTTVHYTTLHSTTLH